MVLGLVHNYAVSLILFIAIGYFTVHFMTTVNSMIQLNANDEHRGRAMSVYSLAFAGTTPIGNLFAGGITEKLGSNAGFFACGITALALLIVILLGINNNVKNRNLSEG
jgi:MFS family permease